MKPKIKRRKFTEKQMELLEQWNYLYKKLWRSELNEYESDAMDAITDKIQKFIDF